MAKKVGVVLSGCGVYDGSEIYEAAFTVLEIERAGAEVVFLAPSVEQMHVIDHAAGAPADGESRNAAVEAARIARGPVAAADAAAAAGLDAVVFPGGFGAAKNLGTFAVDGAECRIHPDIAALIKACHDAGKPMGFMCIAPVVAAKVLGNGVKLTIGNDPGVAEAIAAMGATHVEKPVDDIVVDATQKVVSAPAYMYGDAKRHEIHAGIAKLVAAVLEMA